MFRKNYVGEVTQNVECVHPQELTLVVVPYHMLPVNMNAGKAQIKVFNSRHLIHGPVRSITVSYSPE